VSTPTLFLVGPRGAGKTAAGALAGRRLGVPFVDTDAVVEQVARCSIAELFATQGERYFRALERRVMLELLGPKSTPLLAATGGGCVLDAGVREHLAARRGVLWLTAPLAVLQQRVAGSDRPSLTGEDVALELESLLAEREPLYRASAARGASVDTGTLTLEQVAERIGQHWQLLQRGER
jgi:shikimate kinase